MKFNPAVSKRFRRLANAMIRRIVLSEENLPAKRISHVRTPPGAPKPRLDQLLVQNPPSDP